MIWRTTQPMRQGALLFALVSCLLSRGATAQPSGSAVERAAADYDSRRYQQVIDLLQPLLYPRSQLTSEEEEVSAYTLLGKSYWWLGQLQKPGAERTRLHREAARQFGALLSLRPRTTLSALIHPKELLDFFEEVRATLTAKTSPVKALETELKHCRKSLTDEHGRFTAYRRACSSREVETRSIQRHYFFWNFVPFGAGQFQNGQVLKGGLFAATQGAMFLMNVTSFIIGETSWVRNGKRVEGTVATDLKSLGRAKDIQRVQIASGTIFLALFAWGIIDSLIYYKRTSTVLDRKQIPIPEPKVEVVPDVGRDRLVLGLTARF